MIQSQIIEVKLRTGKLIIDYSKCIAPKCGYACIKADRIFGRGVLKIENGLPKIALSLDEVARVCNECLTCEIYCEFFDGKAIKIELPLELG